MCIRDRSTSAGDNSLMFVGGMRPELDNPLDPPATIYGSFVDAIESDSAEGGETPNRGASDYISEFIDRENQIPPNSIGYKMLNSSMGEGGTSIAGLSQGTTPYNRIIAELPFAQSNSTDQAKSFKARGMSWVQGETDRDLRTTNSVSYTHLTLPTILRV